MGAVMVIRDLKTPCARCHGTGRLAGLPSMLGIAEINASGVCPQCNGRGFLLTELGRDLINLLRPFVEEWIGERGPGSQPPRAVSPNPS